MKEQKNKENIIEKVENQNFIKGYRYSHKEFIWIKDNENYKDDFSEYWIANIFPVTSDEENILEGKYDKFILIYLPESWIYDNKEFYLKKRSLFIAEIENVVRAKLVNKPEDDYLDIEYCFHELKDITERRRFKKRIQAFPRIRNTYYFLKNIRRVNCNLGILDKTEEMIFKVYFDNNKNNELNKKLKSYIEEK